MSTFKSNVFEICDRVAEEFPGWEFKSGQFVNKTLKHSDLVVHMGFGFKQGTTAVVPSISIDNKRANKLTKQLLGFGRDTSLVNMMSISHLLTHWPRHLPLIPTIVDDKDVFLEFAKRTGADASGVLSLTESYDLFRGVLKDAIRFIGSHYDLSSEQALLNALPPKYTTRHEKSPYDQLESQKGIEYCIVRVLLGDFEFPLQYQSDGFKTIFPKRTDELETVIAALPRLKERYTRTGQVI
ncbi:UNVERIFIED_ORG: hypothetical protein BDU10_8371 [Burkholderia sp. CF145]|uniref:hypothetical protein n=1 Tax=Paraburkholderia hospita TaxID=169430 RepID=UPI000271D787|nr:hypothetical protein [Paraburkholderia hospita]EUC19942.1 hypothetical protein PMI06_001741 [Burkholderia sp. BT03]SKD06440.1 hypothetical protein SAMN06266956_9321 [Paraburkholderia hospita]